MLTQLQNNNKRIAKNSLYLYLRMICTMSISFYTSRVVLNVLGVEDFGIYNVVGGIIVILSFFNGSLQSASTRYLTSAIGKSIEPKIKEMFCSILGIHFLLAALILLFGETIGLWFVTNKLMIPEERYIASLWVYQCSVITMIISVISVPYNALVIAYERMNAFAYMSIIEALLKLFIVFILLWFPADKLILYSILYLIVQIVIRIIYGIYCVKNFHFILGKPQWTSKSKELAMYAGWTSNGNLALIANNQGLNIILNIFFGPTVNAARGITNQVQSAVLVFVQNYQMALSPPIIKAYATNNIDYMHKLIVASSKFGYLIMILIIYPLFLLAPVILRVWLGVIPEHTVSFIRVILLVCLIAPLRQTMINAVHATGIIKKFQIYEGTVLLLVVPISYICLTFSEISPETVMLIYAFFEFIAQCVRIYIVLPLIKMSFVCYLREILIRPIIVTSVLSCTFFFMPKYDCMSYFHLLLYFIAIFIFGIVVVYSFGLTSNERHKLWFYIKNK